MNPDSAKRAQAAIVRRGELISVRRGATRADIKATVSGFAPVQLGAPGIIAGARKVVLSRLDLDAAGFPAPPVRGDRIYFGNTFENPTTVETVDADRREYQGCYEITTVG